jgi:autotransporter-associated beta strand protein
MTNGGLTTKAGPGTLTIKNNAGDWASGSLGIQGGSLILDNAAAIQDGNNVRVQCSVPDGTARLVITNGGSLTTSNSASSNFRVGDLAAAGTYNILDLAGTVNVLPYSSPNTGDKFQLGGPGAQDSVNLLPGGMLRARQVAKSGGSLSLAIFNFNGGALSPNTNDFAASFMTGLDYCYILDGGAIIDTAGWNVTIGQQLLTGGTGIGGLTKTGAGTLTLNYIQGGYSCTYSGPTVINAGTLVLGVNEPLYYSTNVIVGTNAILDISAGSFSLTGRTLTPHIAKQGATLSSGLVTAGAGAMIYDGELTVARTGDALTGGETFKLFDAASGYYLAFTATNLPPLTAPLSWDVSGLYVDGTIKVTGSIARPSFGSVQLQGGTNIVLSGSGGTAGGTYHVLSQTNVALPLSLWTPIATNVFSTDGKFTNSIPVDPAKHQSYFDILLQ